MEGIMKKAILLVLLILTTASSTLAALQTKEIDYTEGDTLMKGYLAYDDAITGQRPGILVVHEWWGHNAYARKRAEMLAGLGYTALAVDMYGEGKTAAHPEDAGKFSGEIRKNMALGTARFKAALELLQSEPTVAPDKIAAIGYCFGGAVVLEMARTGIDLDGVASFHGSLGTSNPARPGVVMARILVLNGENDPFVTPEEIEAFKKEMDAAGVNYRFISYPGAKHSFTNPDADTFGEKFTLPLAYNKEADEKSWQAMQKFFIEIFQ
jgi:dienelactone hydrolase